MDREAAGKLWKLQAMLDGAATAVMTLNGGSAVPLWNTWLDGMQEAAPEGGEIDFAYLKTLNEDIYAWITVPGTVIDYHVLQHPTLDIVLLYHFLFGFYILIPESRY